MFEVGKKYGGKTEDPGYEWTCLAVDGNKAWLKFTGTIGYYVGKDGLYGWHDSWEEIKSKVKVDFYINIYRYHNGALVVSKHDTFASAKEGRQPGGSHALHDGGRRCNGAPAPSWVATKHIVEEVEEGEGLV